MGTEAGTAMKFGRCSTGGSSSSSSSSSSLAILVSALLIQASYSYNINRDPDLVDIRGYWQPDDARNLFPVMSDQNYKRSFSSGSINPATYDAMMSAMVKRGRGLRDPYDPRHLFHSIYGGVFRR